MATITNPIEAAVAQLRTSRENLAQQLKLVDQALKALDALGGAEGTADPAQALRLAPHPGEMEPKTFVDMLREITESAAGPWRGKDLRDTLVSLYPNHGSPDPYSAVRTALKTLVDRNELVKVDRGLYQSAKWTNPDPSPETSAGPVGAGPADRTESAVEAADVVAGGGDASDDHRVDHPRPPVTRVEVH